MDLVFKKDSVDQNSFLEPLKPYFIIIPGTDTQSVAQMIAKNTNETKQPITAGELRRLLVLAHNNGFNIYERGFIFQTLLAAAQFSSKQLAKVEELLKTEEANIRTNIPKIARAFRVHVNSFVRYDGNMQIFYNPFIGQSQVTIEYKDINGKVEKSEYTLQGDWANYSMDSYRSVKEIQVQMAAVAQSQGLDSIQQQNLMRIVEAARAIKLREFDGRNGDNSRRINGILKLESADGIKFRQGAEFYLLSNIQTDTPRVRQGYLVELLVSQLSLRPQFFGAVADQLGVKLIEKTPVRTFVASTPADPGGDVGGIDFDPALLDLQIKRDGRGIALPLPQQNLDRINIEGLYPVILNIKPVAIQDFPFFVSANKPSADLAAKK